MRIDLTIKNYRCFSDERPASISIQPGFISFVGVNNSGKSTLLKFFYEFRPILGAFSQPNGNIMNMMRGVADGFSQPLVNDADAVFCDLNSRDIEVEIRINARPARGLRVPNGISLTYSRMSKNWKSKLGIDGRYDYLQDGYDQFMDNFLSYKGTHSIDFQPMFEAFGDLSNTMYIGPFRNAINEGGTGAYFDIQAGVSVVGQWSDWKDGPSSVRRASAHALVDNIKHIFRFDQLQIDASHDQSVLNAYVDGKPYVLHELGSGLSQFFLVLFNAVSRKPTYILIDEPELNLHPALQLDFLMTLASYASRGILFATHNYGLARASAEQIYLVQRNSRQAASEVALKEDTPNLSEFLGTLGFSAYMDLGFDKVLLVEGPSDVTTVQQFLRKYGKDHEILVLPLGGGSGISGKGAGQLEEIKRITPNVFALIDSERNAANDQLDKAHQDFKEACREAHVTLKVMDRRAMENYFPDRAVKEVLGDQYRGLSAFETFAPPNKWSKSVNWRIAREMTKKELDATDIGKFLIRF